MKLLTRYLSPLRVFARLAGLETHVAAVDESLACERKAREEDVTAETAAREKADAALRTEFLQRLAPLSRCARCGCVVDCTHPAVTVMRKGVEAPVAACLFCVSELRRFGFKEVERASA